MMDLAPLCERGDRKASQQSDLNNGLEVAYGGAPSRPVLQVAATEDAVAPPLRVVQIEGLDVRWGSVKLADAHRRLFIDAMENATTKEMNLRVIVKESTMSLKSTIVFESTLKPLKHLLK